MNLVSTISLWKNLQLLRIQWIYRLLISFMSDPDTRVVCMEYIYAVAIIILVYLVLNLAFPRNLEEFSFSSDHGHYCKAFSKITKPDWAKIEMIKLVKFSKYDWVTLNVKRNLYEFQCFLPRCLHQYSGRTVLSSIHKGES